VGLAWLDPATGHLAFLAHNFAGMSESSPPIPSDRGAISLAFTSRQPVVVDHYASWDQASTWAVAQGVASCVAVPVLLGKRALGALALYTRRQRHFEPAEIEFLSLISTQIGVVLNTCRLYAESERRRREAETLAELVRQGATELDTARVLALIAERACSLACSDYSAVILCQHDGMPVRHATHGLRGDAARTKRLLAEPGMIRPIVAQKRLVIVERAGDNDEYPLTECPIHSCEGGRTIVNVPLISRETAVGVLMLGWRTDVRLGPDQTRLLEMLASYAATILDNAYAHDREQQQAREAAGRAGALAASERQIRSLYEAIACGILVRDKSGKIVEVNAAAEEIFGLPAEKIRGRNSDDLWPAFKEDGSSLSPLERPGMVALTTGQPVRNFTMGINRPSGERRWLQITSVPIFGPDGSPVEVVSSFIDVTTRKEAESQLQSLAQTEKLRALGQMASGVAHDLNQYLGLITGHSDLALRSLERGESDLDTLRESLRTIIQAATDGAETIKHLLTFARPPQVLPFARLVLGDLLSEVARLTAPRWRDAAQAEGRQVAVEVAVEGDTTMEGSPESLREAIANLIFNAVDALPDGGTIRLVARRQDSVVQAEVADNGVGMSDEIRARIFEPFFTTKGDRGTGLGLAVVFGVVKQHRGEISIDSAPGRGSTFRLTFPAAPPAAPDRAMAPKESRGHGLRILAVDDELPLAKMIALMLSPDGHSVAVATSGEDALRLLEEKPFDLVISDVGMGHGMNGWQLGEIIRSRFPTIRFCLATGWGAQIDPQQAKSRGVHAIVAKPYRMADLRRLVADAST
jgi:PAS domain S-box-containing protein